MFVKNYNLWYSLQLLGTWGSKDVPVTLYNGSAFSNYGYLSMYNSTILELCKVINNGSYMEGSSTNGANRVSGVIFGNGTTAPTVDDYKLSGDAVTGLSSSNVTYTTSSESVNGTKQLTVVYTISNTTGAAITIGEIGLLQYVGTAASSSGSSTYRSVLIERTVLEEPVTIPAGGIGRVEYKIILNYPIG